MMFRSSCRALIGWFPVHSRITLVLIPATVVVVGFTATALAAADLRANERAAAAARIDRTVERTEAAISVRFGAYEDALTAGAALFAASDQVTLREWVLFTQRLNLPERYPGVNGMGVIFPVANEGQNTFLAARRSDVDPAFRIRQLDGGRLDADLFIITYIEPIAGNEPARGLDVGSEPARRAAIEIARDTGNATMTGPIVLVQDATARPGFLVYVPFYRSGAPIATVEQRRAAIQGFIYAPFVTARFLEGVFGSLVAVADLQIVQKGDEPGGGLVYAEGAPFDPSRADRTRELALGGQTFELRFQGTNVSTEEGTATTVVAGVVITLALAALAFALLFTAFRARKRALEAERTAQHRGDLVNLASHELRNPLAILSLSAEMLEAEAKRSAMPLLEELASGAHSAAMRAEALIAELLDLSRLDAQRLLLDPVPTDLLAAIQRALTLTVSHWGPRPVSIDGTVAMQRLVIADPTRLGIILRNLVDNAFKYSPDGTPIAINAHCPTDAAIAITVRDNGAGVAPGDRTAVFSRFARGEGSVGTTGLGIGLFLSRELARLMGGDLVLLPANPGDGAAFRLVLPMAPAATREQAA